MNKQMLIGAAMLLVVAGPALSAQSVPPNYKAQIIDYMRTTLKDPYSVRAAAIGPAQEVKYNWQSWPGVCVRLNAKNSYGAYSGLETLVAAFKDGKLMTP